MKDKMKAIFDYQKFRRNAKLQRMIDDTELRCGLNIEALSDEDLGLLSAAGEQEIRRSAQDEPKF